MGQKYNPDEIAIIGVGCVLPAGLGDRESLWQFLLERRDGCVAVPGDRWGRKRFYDPVDQTPGKTTMQYGHFMDPDDHQFEPLFFGISPREGMVMDIQQRLLLGVAWRAMENAGVIARSLEGTRTGVFMGSFTQDQLVQCGSPFMQSQIRDQFAAVSAGMTMYAARIAHVYGLKGPAIAMDTACSSSLVALHQASNALRLGECDVALAGGVNFMASPQTAMLMTKGHFLAKDGRSKSFAADADGYGRGEGCVILMLKRLKDALRDGNDIRGVVCSSGVNQDGHTPVLTMPDADAQQELITDVLRRAGVAPREVAYVEAHGTGTPVGDPIEIKAIGQAVGQHQPEGEKVIVGSIKANLGHMEAAAGGVAVIKAMLCLEHGMVPGQANLKELNPAIPFDDYRVQVAQGETPVPLPERETLYAVVNSFGYGGTNAVALLRRPTEAERNAAGRKAVSQNRLKGVRPAGFMRRTPLLLSAFSEASLAHMAGAYAGRLDEEGAQPHLWEALCFSAVHYRARFRNRAIILPEPGEGELPQARAALEALAAGKTHPALFTGKAVVDEAVKPVFLFSGMGPQWWGMGRYLLRKGPADVRALAQRCDELFAALAGWSLREELLQPESRSRVQETEVAQPAIFLVQVCLAAFFAHHGITPGAVIGHSVGEVAAAHVAGALSLEDAVCVIYHRSRLQATRAGHGTMLAVGMSRNVLEGRLEPFGGRLAIAAINSGESCTVVGPRDALEQLEADCQREGIFARFLKVDVPYHSPEMAAIEEGMLTSLAGITPRAPDVPLYSTVTGKAWQDGERHDNAYWYANAREPVLFHDAMRAMLKDGYTIFLELAAHPVLGGSVTGCAEEGRYEVAVIPTLRRKQDDADGLLRALVRLALSGAEPDWRYVLRPRRTDLPLYRWEVENKAWLETEASRRDRLDEQVHPILGTPSLLESRAWRADIGVVSMEWLMDHKVHGMALFPAAAYIEAALAAHAQLEARDPAVIEDITINTPLVVQEGQAPVVMWRFDTATRRLSFDSETISWNGDWQTHGHATVLQAAPWCRADGFDMAALCREAVRFEGAEVYQGLAAMGLDYGPAFQTLQCLYRGEGYSVAEVALGEEQVAHLEDYLLHPALLDGAMHALIGAFPFEEQKDVYVPASIERISYFGQKLSRVHVKATPTLRTERKIMADLQLFTPEGELVCEVLGLCCRRVARGGQDASSAARLVYAPNWVSAERQVLLSEPMAITLLGDGQGLAGQVAALLEDNGATLTRSTRLDAADLAATLEHESFLGEQRALVLFPHGSDDYQQCLDDLAGCVALFQRVPMRGRKRRLPVIIVTRGAYDGDGQAQACQRAFHGLFRGAEAERADLAIRCIDVPAGDVTSCLEDLAAELVLTDPSEDTVWLRPAAEAGSGEEAVDSTDAGAGDDTADLPAAEAPAVEAVERMVQRLVSPPLEPEPQPVPLEEIMGGVDAGDIGVRLEGSRSGALDGVSWQAYAVPEPGPGEVKIRTRMASLNFKDVLKAMGLLPESVTEGTFSGDALGLECVVEVEAIGPGVDNMKPGDLFALVYPDSFAYRRNVSVRELAYCALPLSEEMLQFPLEQIAGVPLVFVTSYYTLVHLAQLQPGESVLIHAGAGGVGQAAIQIAKLRGAVIYSTAGNPEKRDYLRKQGCAGVWDSRTLEFVDGIREATDGRGVDVVLNSLPGEAMVHSLKLVAPMGRFVEIGKRDIVEHRALDLMPFNENLAYFSFDMDRMMPHEKLYGIMDEIMLLARQGKLAFPPTRIFPAAEVSEAFRYLMSSRHIGKIMISYEDMSGLKARPLPRALPGFSRRGAYLVTGGMGGFGLKTAEYLLSQGAGVLHLAGRSLPKTPERKKAIATLRKLAESAGGKVVTHRLDVTDARAVKALVSKLARDEVPLRGVFHAAGVVDDQLISKMDEGNIALVMAPKVLGAMALDAATRDLELDHFVLYSSFTAEIGNLGQSSYIAANSYLNALAENRRQQGLPALAVGWGAIGDVGMLTESDAAGRMFDVAGIKTMKAADCLALLPVLYGVDRSDVSLVDLNWAQVFGALGWLKLSARFALLQQESRKGGISDSVQLLMNMPEGERLDYVLLRLKQQLGSVLQVDPESIADSARLSELGIDSLAGVELQTAIRSEFGVDVSLVLLARNETIIEMARTLLRQAVMMVQQGGTVTLEGAQAAVGGA